MNTHCLSFLLKLSHFWQTKLFSVWLYVQLFLSGQDAFSADITNDWS